MTDDEQQLLDAWWGRRSSDEQKVLIEHRDGLVPGDHREAVKDLMPGGAVVGDDLVGPFRLPPLMAEYVAMKAADRGLTQQQNPRAT
jgi:hypothetical protein